MRTKKSHIVFLLFCAWLVLADSWSWPDKKDYESPNGMFRFEVVPTDIRNPFVCNTSETSCIGRLYSLKDRKTLWNRTLLNKVSPVFAVVSNTGERVITFDDWGNLGYGRNVVVAYSSIGAVVARYALEDILSNEQIQKVPHSVSSRWWRGPSWIEPGDSVVTVVLRTAINSKENQAQMDSSSIKHDTISIKICDSIVPLPVD